MPDKRILFRADGNSSIGLGHIFRSLALIEMLKSDFECLFIINQPSDIIRTELSKHCTLLTLDISDKQAELSVLNDVIKPTDIFVIDGYSFDVFYQQEIKKIAMKLVMIDDREGIDMLADLVINHGLQYSHNYLKESFTSFDLRGFRFLIVRNPFIMAARQKRAITKVNSVFICMGGADPFNITKKAVIASTRCHFIKNITIVLGSAYTWRAELSKMIRTISPHKNISLETNIDAVRIVELVRKSEIAICPASSMALEVCCIKSGLITGTFIDNQYLIHDQLIEKGCAISVNDFNTASVETIEHALNRMASIEIIQTMIENQSCAIDGWSNERILHVFKQL